MEEDVLGPRQTLGRKYTTCARCGQAIPRGTARLQEIGTREGTHSAVADLCPECAKATLTATEPVEPDE
jgi:hypothetical protein